MVHWIYQYIPDTVRTVIIKGVSVTWDETPEEYMAYGHNRYAAINHKIPA